MRHDSRTLDFLEQKLKTSVPNSRNSTQGHNVRNGSPLPTHLCLSHHTGDHLFCDLVVSEVRHQNLGSIHHDEMGKGVSEESSNFLHLNAALGSALHVIV